VFNTYAAILADMKNKNIYKEKDFEAADGIIGSMAPIAVLPVYNDKDIKDIAKGIIKVVKGIS
jgi:hypothetical protein